MWLPSCSRWRSREAGRGPQTCDERPLRWCTVTWAIVSGRQPETLTQPSRDSCGYYALYEGLCEGTEVTCRLTGHQIFRRGVMTSENEENKTKTAEERQRMGDC